MNQSKCAAIAIAMLSLIGCRHDPQISMQVEKLRAEHIWLEDQYIDLQADYDDVREQLASANDEKLALRKRLGITTDDEPAIRQSRRQSEQRVPRDANNLLEPPTIDFGTPEESGQNQPTPVNPSFGDQAQFPNMLRGENLPVTYSQPVPADSRVTHIALDPQRTITRDFDGKPGHDGISVVLEPRNVSNQFVPAAGPVSVVVLDPQLENSASRIARWDIETDEISQRLQSGEQGIHLNLPWPKGRPRNSMLHLFVRYTTKFGERLEADMEIDAAREQELSSRWTPKSSSNQTPRQFSLNPIREQIQLRPTDTAIPIEAHDNRVAPASASQNSEPSWSQKKSQPRVSNSAVPTWSPHR